MTAFTYGDVTYSGEYGYVTHIEADGTFVQQILIEDDFANLMAGRGQSFDNAGNLYVALGTPANDQDYEPHDVCVLPDQSGLIAAIARLDDTLELWRYNLDGTLHSVVATGIDIDTGWTRAKWVKIDIDCDSKTVFYTDQGATIFRYHLDTGQLAVFDVLGGGSPYEYCAFKLLPDGGLVAALTITGNGPRQALCLDASGLYHWTDEINPPDSIYSVYKRQLTDGEEILSEVVTLDPSNTNDLVFSLACWYTRCYDDIYNVTLIGAT